MLKMQKEFKIQCWETSNIQHPTSNIQREDGAGRGVGGSRTALRGVSWCECTKVTIISLISLIPNVVIRGRGGERGRTPLPSKHFPVLILKFCRIMGRS